MEHEFVWRWDSLDCSICGQPHSGAATPPEAAGRGDVERAERERDMNADGVAELTATLTNAHEVLRAVLLFGLADRPDFEFGAKAKLYNQIEEVLKTPPSRQPSGEQSQPVAVDEGEKNNA